MKWIPTPEEDIYVAGITQTDIPDRKTFIRRGSFLLESRSEVKRKKTWSVCFDERIKRMKQMWAQ